MKLQYNHVIRFFEDDDKYMLFDTVTFLEIEVNCFGYDILKVIKIFKILEIKEILIHLKNKYPNCTINDIEEFIFQLLELNIIREEK